MKRILLIAASLMIAYFSFAQSDARSSNFYSFNNAGRPKEVWKLGAAPEFPFLRNLNTSQQVYDAIKKQDRYKTADMNRLNRLLRDIGYANGAKDLIPSDITAANLTPGTEGNMGSKGHSYGYYKLEASTADLKAWRIEPNNEGGNKYGALYILSTCGNAFFPKNEERTACINVPVNVTGDMSQVKLNSSGSKVTTNDEVYVYYGRKRPKRDQEAYPIADINTKYPSEPVMVSSTKTVDIVPETYTVSLDNTDNNKVTACTNSTLKLTANISVEKTSAYTGNYPARDHKIYKKISKREYKMIARKMRRIHRKEDKIARKTHMAVEVRTKSTV